MHAPCTVCSWQHGGRLCGPQCSRAQQQARHQPRSLCSTRLGSTAPPWRCRYVDTGGSGSGLYEENIAVKARLILHFDINKTILMSDKAQDASTEQMVNVLLCECAWGRLEPGPKWVPVGRLATDRYRPPASGLCMGDMDFVIACIHRVLLCKCTSGCLKSSPRWATCRQSCHLQMPPCLCVACKAV